MRTAASGSGGRGCCVEGAGDTSNCPPLSDTRFDPAEPSRRSRCCPLYYRQQSTYGPDLDRLYAAVVAAVAEPEATTSHEGALARAVALLFANEWQEGTITDGAWPLRSLLYHLTEDAALQPRDVGVYVHALCLKLVVGPQQ